MPHKENGMNKASLYHVEWNNGEYHKAEVLATSFYWALTHFRWEEMDEMLPISNVTCNIVTSNLFECKDEHSVNLTIGADNTTHMKEIEYYRRSWSR